MFVTHRKECQFIFLLTISQADYSAVFKNFCVDMCACLPHFSYAHNEYVCEYIDIHIYA